MPRRLQGVISVGNPSLDEEAHILGGTPSTPSTCYILDEHLAHLYKGITRRLGIAYRPHYDYPQGIRDDELLETAIRIKCPVVSSDTFFRGKPCSIYLSHRYLHTHNTWEQVTFLAKKYREAVSTCFQL